MERIASEFNKLQYSVSQTGNHPLVEQIKPVSQTVQCKLYVSVTQLAFCFYSLFSLPFLLSPLLLSPHFSLSPPPHLSLSSSSLSPPPPPPPPLPPSIQRIATITATLQNSLEESFRGSLEKGDRDGLTRCLQTYTSINRQEAAESMFQSTIVRPYMEKVHLAVQPVQW